MPPAVAEVSGDDLVSKKRAEARVRVDLLTPTCECCGFYFAKCGFSACSSVVVPFSIRCPARRRALPCLYEPVDFVGPISFRSGASSRGACARHTSTRGFDASRRPEASTVGVGATGLAAVKPAWLIRLVARAERRAGGRGPPLHVVTWVRSPWATGRGPMILERVRRAHLAPRRRPRPGAVARPGALLHSLEFAGQERPAF
jgi:hypothetical protein